MNRILETALHLHSQGISVIPVREGKQAAVRWKPYQSEPPEIDMLHRWFKRERFGLAAICGKVSGNLVMLELEGRAANLEQKIRTAAEESGQLDLWQTVNTGWKEQSPTGGIHWFIKCKEEVNGNTRLAANRDNLVLAETRGEGGYTVIAPSSGYLHPTGKGWKNICFNQIPVLTKTELDKVTGWFKSLDQSPAKVETTHQVLARATRVGREQTQPRVGERAGDAFNRLAQWKDILTPHGWQIHHQRGQTTYWTRPGKDPQEGISASTNTDGNDRLYVFSTSTPFPVGEPVSKFHAFATLECRGDMRAAAKLLAQKGYGQQWANNKSKTEALIAATIGTTSGPSGQGQAQVRSKDFYQHLVHPSIPTHQHTNQKLTQ